MGMVRSVLRHSLVGSSHAEIPIQSPGNTCSQAHHHESLQQGTSVRLRARLSCFLMQHPNSRRSSCPPCLNPHWRNKRTRTAAPDDDDD